MKITPETYEKMNEEFIEKGEMFRINVPTQNAIDEWQKKTEYHEPPLGPDMIVEMWKNTIKVYQETRPGFYEFIDVQLTKAYDKYCMEEWNRYNFGSKYAITE